MSALGLTENTTNTTGSKRKRASESAAGSLASSPQQVTDLDVLEDHIHRLKQWIQFYDADWSQAQHSESVTVSAQDKAEKSLLGATERVQNARDGIRLAIVGLMRSGKSSLLSTLIGGISKILPEMASTISTTMVPVEVGRNDDSNVLHFTVSVGFVPLKQLRLKQRALASEVLEVAKIPADPQNDFTEDDGSAQAQSSTEQSRLLAAQAQMDDLINSAFDEFMNDDSEADAARAHATADDTLPLSAAAALSSSPVVADTFKDWICSTRDGSFALQNHRLKSLFRVLDQCDGSTSESILLARSFIEALASEDDVLSLTDSQREATGYATQERLVSDDPSASRIVTFHFDEPDHVHLLLYFLGIDHAAARYQIGGDKYDADVSELSSHVGNPNDAHVAIVLDALKQPLLYGINSLWPLVDNIEIKCPASIWTLPPRFRLLDTAGLSSARKQDGTIDIDQSLMRKMKVNRLWFSTRSAAASAGNVEDLAKDVARQLLDLPLDVIITQIDASGGLEQKEFDNEADHVTRGLPKIRSELSSTTQSRAFPISTYWRRLEIDPNSTDQALQAAKAARAFDPNYRSGFQELEAHLRQLQDDQARSAQVSLMHASVLRMQLLVAASKLPKFPSADTVLLAEAVEKGIQLASSQLEHDFDSSSDAMAQDLQDKVLAATTVAATAVLLADKFTTAAYKRRDWRQLIAWAQKEDGELGDDLSLSSMVTHAYFLSSDAFSTLVNDFLASVSIELKKNFEIVLKRVQEAVEMQFNALKSIPTSQLTAVREALQSCSALPGSTLPTDVMIVLHTHIVTLWQQSSGDVAGVVRDQLGQSVNSPQKDWKPAFPLSGAGIKSRLLNHVESFVKKHAAWFFATCGSGFAACLAPTAAWIADAHRSLLDGAVSLVWELLRAVWQPLPPERVHAAQLDLKNMYSALRRHVRVDASTLLFLKSPSPVPPATGFDPSSLPASSLSSSSLGQTWKKEMILIKLPTGEDRVLLFRGLCGLTTTVRGGFKRTEVGPFSPLFVPSAIVHCDIWNHMSSLAVILHAYRRIQTQRGVWKRVLHQSLADQVQFFLPTALVAPSTAPDAPTTDLEQLAEQIRDLMLEHMQSTQPPANHPAASMAHGPATWRNWWSKNSKSRKQEFTNLALPFQQLYSNDDKRFMLSFQTFIETNNLSGSALDRAVAHVTHWRRAAELISWRWVSKLLRDGSNEARMLENPVLHTNPDVSMSKQLQHAMRYAVGLKNYAQGTQKGFSELLMYGRVSSQGAFAPLGADEEKAYRTPRAGDLLGSVVVFAVPEAVLSEPHVMDVNREMEKGALWVDFHVSHESEVCFYGFIPKSYQVWSYQLTLLNFDRDTIRRLEANQLTAQEIVDYERYGFTAATLAQPEGKAQLRELRQVLLRVAKQCLQQQTRGGEWHADLELDIREMLGTLAFAALRTKLITEGYVLPPSFVAEKIVRGTKRG